MKVIILAVISILLFLNSGCARITTSCGKGNDQISDVYARSQTDANKVTEEQLKVNKSLGYVKPYVPVINPPEVKRAWVLPHKTEDGSLIGGYWVYVIIKDVSWYIETPQVNMPAITIPYKQETETQKLNHQSQEDQSEQQQEKIGSNREK